MGTIYVFICQKGNTEKKEKKDAAEEAETETEREIDGVKTAMEIPSNYTHNLFYTNSWSILLFSELSLCLSLSLFLCLSDPLSLALTLSLYLSLSLSLSCSLSLCSHIATM